MPQRRSGDDVAIDPGALFAAAAIALGAVAFVLSARPHPSPPRLAPARAGALPLTSVIIPARDEARNIGALLESLTRLEHDAVEILVVDGGSSDGTRAIAAGFAAWDPRIRVFDEPPLPAGWVGKSWAAHHGRRHARGEWLLFTDADTLHAPASLRRAIQTAAGRGAGYLTGLTRQRLGSFWERVTMPPAFTLIHAATSGHVTLDDPTLSVANGQYILIRADAYDALGGHAHPDVRGSIVEDLSLARLAAARRVPGAFLDLSDSVEVRMYANARELFAGWRKNVAAGAARTPILQTLGTAATLGIGMLALPLALVGAWICWPLAAAAGLAAAGATLRVRRAHREAVGALWWHALLHPLGYAFFAVVLAVSTFDRWSGHGPTWKGRRYGVK